MDWNLVWCLLFLYLMNVGLELAKRRNMWFRCFDVCFIETFAILFYYFLFKG